MEILILQKTIKQYLTAYFKLLSAPERNVVLIMKISFLPLRFEKSSNFQINCLTDEKAASYASMRSQGGAMKENSAYETKGFATIKVLPIWLIYNIATSTAIKLSQWSIRIQP